MKTENALLDVYDAAEILLLSTRRVRLLVKQQQLSHVALPNGEIRFIEADLFRWIDSHKQSAIDIDTRHSTKGVHHAK